MLNTKKILVVSIYPISNAQHGGQKRVKAFVDFYRTVYKEVRHISVFYEPDYPDFDPAVDFPVKDKSILNKIKQNSVVSDHITGRSLYDDDLVQSKVREVILDYQPDIIECEQSFPFVSIKRLVDDMGYRVKLIFNSQNIESKMKRLILNELDQSNLTIEPFLKEIEKDESAASRQASLVIASSESDVKFHKKMGAKRVVYVRNGIEKVTPTMAAVEHWRKFKNEMGAEKLITYVGSAHPPNLTGFAKMIGFDLEFLNPNARFMIAGGVSQYMQDYIAKNKKFQSFWDKASPLGRLSDDNLAGLIAESDVIVLPITTGGGSNLKTAEALASGKHIVATKFAFRSFEEYLPSERIVITNNPSEFRSSINAAVLKKTFIRQRKSGIRKVYWHELLNDKRFSFELSLADSKAKAVLRYMFIWIWRKAKRVWGYAARTLSGSTGR